MVYYILTSAGMKFKNKNKFLYGIPAYTGPFRTLLQRIKRYYKLKCYKLLCCRKSWSIVLVVIF
jgi:hypothetical protein